MNPPAESNVAVVRHMPGEPTRFQVRSKSNPDTEHIVDLAAYNGAGECDCIRFDTVCRPLIMKTGNLPPSKRCRHIKQATAQMAMTAKLAQNTSRTTQRSNGRDQQNEITRRR